jgi:hypothetical protein
MGRQSKLKQARRDKRRHSLNEAWGFFTSRKFLWQVRKMILDSGVNTNSSVCCTKVFTELGLAVGLDIQPLSVEVSVFNPVFAAFIEKNGLNPSDAVMRNLGEAGGRFVVLGAKGEHEPKAEDAWPGHLVAVISARGRPSVVVDLTIDQASRPTKDINIVDPLVFGVPDDFLTGKSVATGFCASKAGKLCFVYRAYPDDKSFEPTADWQRDYGAKTHDKVEIVSPESG